MDPVLKVNPSISQVISEVKKLSLEQRRTDLPTFFECVIRKECLAGLILVLEKYFGPPAKPAGEKPAEKIEEYAASFGGILKNQILYLQKKEGESTVFLAMIWPWTDGQLLTVKLIEDQL